VSNNYKIGSLGYYVFMHTYKPPQLAILFLIGNMRQIIEDVYHGDVYNLTSGAVERWELNPVCWFDEEAGRWARPDGRAAPEWPLPASP
jgi:hypothetical protein